MRQREASLSRADAPSIVQNMPATRGMRTGMYRQACEGGVTLGIDTTVGWPEAFPLIGHAGEWVELRPLRLRHAMGGGTTLAVSCTSIGSRAFLAPATSTIIAEGRLSPAVRGTPL